MVLYFVVRGVLLAFRWEINAIDTSTRTSTKNDYDPVVRSLLYVYHISTCRLRNTNEKNTAISYAQSSRERLGEVRTMASM